MVQYQKEEIREAIIKGARDDFIEKGFQQASIRQIAKKADVLPSNIYNYFDSKDDLFGEILNPIIKKLEYFKKFLISWEFDRSSDNKHGDLKEHQYIMVKTVQEIDKDRELFNLLIFKSQGSFLESYMDELVDWYTDKWHSAMVRRGEDRINKILIHNIASIWLNSIKEILRYNLTGRELELAAVDMITFIYKGYSGLMERKNKNI